MTPGLQNFVSQSRAAGMPDAQIRQTLASQGVAEADIFEALGGSRPAAVIHTEALRTARGSSSKVLVIIILMLLTAGVAAWYLLFSDKDLNDEIDTKATNNILIKQEENTSGPFAFRCKDLLSDTEFEEFTKINVSNFDFTEYYYPEKYSITCEYTAKREYIDKRVAAGDSSNASGQNIWFAIKQNDQNNDYFELKTYQQKHDRFVSYSGLGSDAHKGSLGTLVLSSNKKYIIRPLSIEGVDWQGIVKIVDANLNKY